jgi:hypothetical protein
VELAARFGSRVSLPQRLCSRPGGAPTGQFPGSGSKIRKQGANPHSLTTRGRTLLRPLLVTFTDDEAGDVLQEHQRDPPRSTRGLEHGYAEQHSVVWRRFLPGNLKGAQIPSPALSRSAFGGAEEAKRKFFLRIYGEARKSNRNLYQLAPPVGSASLKKRVSVPE